MTGSSQRPEVDGTACVLTASPLASCRACVDACPHQAWILDDDSLALDEAACDGCGVCRPACPEDAIAFPLDPALCAEKDGRVTLFLACDRSDVRGEDRKVPCIHALGLRDLCEFSDQGLERICVAHPDCDTCSRSPRDTLERALIAFNELRRSRSRPTIDFEHCPAGAWQRRRRASRPARPPVDVDRRRFLRFLVAGNGEPADVEAPQAAQPPQAGGLLYANVPRMDAASCNGCDACIRICPHDALQLIESDGGPAYRIDADQCTGCGLCQDVCDQAAIAVHRMAQVTQSCMPLRRGRCRVCGSPFHVPAESECDNQVCRICSGTNHYARLFQVESKL